MALPFDPGEERYVNLVTFRRNGVEVPTPVWIARHGPDYYVFSEGKAGKVKRIRANGRVRMAACDVRGKVRSEWIEGRARIVSDEQEIEGMYGALIAKYGFQMRVANILAKASGRYQRRAIIAIAGDSLSPVTA